MLENFRLKSAENSAVSCKLHCNVATVLNWKFGFCTPASCTGTRGATAVQSVLQSGNSRAKCTEMWRQQSKVLQSRHCSVICSSSLPWLATLGPRLQREPLLSKLRFTNIVITREWFLSNASYCSSCCHDSPLKVQKQPCQSTWSSSYS